MRHHFSFYGSSEPVSADDHKLALERVIADLNGAQLREVRDVARGLELPFDTVIDLYRQKLSGIDQARRMAEMSTAEAVLEIRSVGADLRPVKIDPNEIYEVVARPQMLAFKIKRLEILDRPELWKIRSLRIGMREQLKHGPVAGHLLDSMLEEGHEGPFDVAQCAMDVALLVQWLGDEPAMFDGKFHGLATV